VTGPRGRKQHQVWDLDEAVRRASMHGGQIALELFSGSGNLSRAWRRSCLRHIEIVEVDIRHGAHLDLLNETLVRKIRGWARAGLIAAVWLAPPCSSFSALRCLFSPVRSRAFPLGLPSLSPSDQRVVNVANRLCIVASSLLDLCRRLNIPCVVENPHTSLLWNVKAFENLAKTRGVEVCVTDYCAWGTPWRKRTRFLFTHLSCNSLGKTCCGRGVCSFSGKRHVEIIGNHPCGVKYSKLSEPYPPRLCAAFVRCFANAVFRPLSQPFG